MQDILVITVSSLVSDRRFTIRWSRKLESKIERNEGLVTKEWIHSVSSLHPQIQFE